MKTLLLALLLSQLPTQASNGVVTGKITALDGTPAAGVRVAAVPVSDANVPLAAPVLSSIAQTDADGNYRLANVAPGSYYVMAGLVDRPTYYPGVAAPAPNSLVRVTGTAAVSGIDFRLAQAVSLKVSGRVDGLKYAAGSPVVASARVTLLPRTPPLGGMLSATLKPTDFTFEFANVPPGTYSVQVGGPATYVLKENMIITVGDKSIADLVLAMVDTAVLSKMEGLQQVWTLPGQWRGLTLDATSGTLYGVRSGNLVQIDADAKTKSEVRFTGSPVLRVAHFGSSDQPAFLSFGTWSSNVQAFDSKGQLLWVYPPPDSPGSGIDDVWPIDLDGDQSDEVIVGFNDSSGLHVLDSKGNVVWKVTAGIGNVWHVSGGNVFGDGKPAVVSTSAKGDVHIFTENGTKRTDVNPGIYANMVRVGKVRETDKSDTIIVGASGTTNATIAALVSGDELKPPATNPAAATDLLQYLETIARQRLPEYGKTKWKLELPPSPTPSIQSAYLAPGRPWLAVGLSGGIVHVVDADRGAVIATIDGQGQNPGLAWLPVKDAAPLLAVSSANGLFAYRVTPTKPAP